MFAPLIGFSMIAYFYNPSDLLHEIINLDTSAWSLWAYSITSVFFFVMINRLRHHFCRNACPYGMLQMILSDKNSRKGGVRNMFRGAGLALTILMMVLASFLLFAIYTNIGFAISIGKNLQGVPVQGRIIYTYNLQIENLKNKPAVFHINYENIPAAWNLKIPEEAPNEVKTGPNSTKSIPLLFRVDQASIGQSNIITVKIANEDGKEITRQINIFPIKK
ncbi:FixG Ig-like domain-containing protein [Aneurinibacillus tyrosinisolvens]|uniref:FixG Ig-like domain-containing protein n=1 Tax=Aneurinibacillus tyrosinisolvens TaxID=1443435 RepID=UPI00063F4554|nr:FixG Ig-like domain-containing protein [Aneurinibacillus tyrosinisolvens]